MIGTFNHFVRQTFVRYYEPRGLPQTSGPDRWSSLWFRLLSYSSPVQELTINYHSQTATTVMKGQSQFTSRVSFILALNDH